jgi:hypothetical protein
MKKKLILLILPGIIAVLFLIGCKSLIKEVTKGEEPGLDNTREKLYQDLDQFQRELEERFAYLKANNVDYKTALHSVRDMVTNGISMDELGIELRKIIGLFIDCHASVTGFSYTEGFLPFLVEPIGDSYVAFWPDHSGFIEPSFPFITKIDDINIDDWCIYLKPLIPQGTPQYVKIHALRILGYLQFARTMVGLEQSSHLTVELESKDRSTRKSLQLSVSDQLLYPVAWPDSNSHIMAGNIGYLRITGWGEEAFAEVAAWMPQFHDTDGLIIDIRHNPGGTRNVLRDLYPYFVKESEKPRIAGVAKYRLYSEFGPDHLESRHMYPQHWSGWTSAEQNAITEFMQTFKPEWDVPGDEFSDWHFWVLSKRSNPGAYDYTKPVVFLMDQRCFSASDVILSSVKGMPNVTLVGSSSGGGSGAAISTNLKNSQFKLRLSSMASFQSSGKLFDSRGVDPDIFIEPVPGHFLENGPDQILELAIQIISNNTLQQD